MSDQPYEQSPQRAPWTAGHSGPDYYAVEPDGRVHGPAGYPQGGLMPGLQADVHYGQPQQLQASDSPIGKAVNEAWSTYATALGNNGDPSAAMKVSEKQLQDAVTQANDQFKAAATEFKAVSNDDKVAAAVKQLTMDNVDLMTAVDRLAKDITDKNGDPGKLKRDGMLMELLSSGLLKDGDPARIAAEKDLKADGLWDAYNRGQEDEKNPDVVRMTKAIDALKVAGLDASVANHFYGTALHQNGRWSEERDLRQRFTQLTAMIRSAEPGAEQPKQ